MLLEQSGLCPFLSLLFDLNEITKKRLLFSFPPRTPLKNIRTCKSERTSMHKIVSNVWPCFVSLIPSSKCYDLHLTGRETDSRGIKRLRGRNRTHKLADLGASARISFASHPLDPLHPSKLRRLWRSHQL